MVRGIVRSDHQLAGALGLMVLIACSDDARLGDSMAAAFAQFHFDLAAGDPRDGACLVPPLATALLANCLIYHYLASSPNL